ncbi:hypothetical protein [Allorhizocola rhizosphaerae]|uniref:hypothetical protein n=1 Tax=Allorhizocola rhizosphaerae TaxID=1872709 RepID=UPI0013C321EB|nr:hypothetical protein [Allorhizocola rhizosphaerae]
MTGSPGIPRHRLPTGDDHPRFVAEGRAPVTHEDERHRSRVSGITSWQQVSQVKNTYGVVPIVPFPCSPDLGEEPEAVFAGVLDVQDRINFGILNRMTAERYGAFRQKHVTGHKFKRSTDPDTGMEIVESFQREGDRDVGGVPGRGRPGHGGRRPRGDDVANACVPRARPLPGRQGKGRFREADRAAGAWKPVGGRTAI